MFSLSTKSDYGLLLLSLLAKNRKKGLISISKISQQTRLPSHYLSRIAAELVSGGILKSKEGITGGYQLAKRPGKISIAQVIEVLDGHFAPTRCTGVDKKCQYEIICPMVDGWRIHLKKKIWNLLDSYTIQDLIN